MVTAQFVGGRESTGAGFAMFRGMVSGLRVSGWPCGRKKLTGYEGRYVRLART